MRGLDRNWRNSRRGIHAHRAFIARAEARDNCGELKVFVELRDINYPGSTYNLTYDRTRDLLHGVYFHAVAGQKYDVAFKRLPPRR